MLRKRRERENAELINSLMSSKVRIMQNVLTFIHIPFPHNLEGREQFVELEGEKFHKLLLPMCVIYSLFGNNSDDVEKENKRTKRKRTTNNNLSLFEGKDHIKCVNFYLYAKIQIQLIK